MYNAKSINHYQVLRNVNFTENGIRVNSRFIDSGEFPWYNKFDFEQAVFCGSYDFKQVHPSDQYPELCNLAIDYDPKNIQYVLDLTHGQCLKAVTADPSVIRFIPHEHQDDHVKAQALRNPENIIYLDSPTKEDWVKCVFRVPSLMVFVKDLATISDCITSNPSSIAYCRCLTSELVARAIKFDPEVIKFPNVRDFVKENNIQITKENFVHHPKNDISSVVSLVVTDGELIKHVKDRTLRKTLLGLIKPARIKVSNSLSKAAKVIKMFNS